MAVDERIGGAPVPRVEMNDMIGTVQDCELYDLKSYGSFYTWNNKHEHKGKIYSRLDRVLINEDWALEFSDSYATFLPEGLFDHCPCLISFEGTRVRSGAPFRYYNMWSRATDFEGIVHISWKEEVHGTIMFKLVTKLKRLKSELKKLNREQFSDIENLAKVIALSLTQVQIQLRADPLNEQLCYAERECAKEMEFLARARTDYLKQKSKIIWLKEGDENTSFFHTSIKRRRARNRVYQVKDMRGNLCTQHDDVKATFEEYYISLLGSSNPVNPVKRSVVRHGRCLNSSHCKILMAPVTHEEVTKAMFDIPGTKAPGPDGYCSQFFKDCWELWGERSLLLFKKFFRLGNF
ncbi:uncharacterized protein LOC141639083 [Silene latifolia]|uniref:uncharacterized protein LOC141639083 n=1 Tax=Silene latifolia TaxID=37657 RepID=UPI003D786498